MLLFGVVVQIPSLLHAQLHQLQPNSLVRVRCMVQDMLEPEYFMGAYETAQSHQLVCGFYQDAAASEVRVLYSRSWKRSNRKQQTGGHRL